MSWLSRAASNVLSGARRLASSIIPESVQRRLTDFGNWITGYVGPEQTSRILNKIAEHVRMNYPPRQSFARVHTIDGILGYDAREKI